MATQINPLNLIKRQPRWRVVAALVVIGSAILLLNRGGGSTNNGATFVARRGPLDITVLQGGSTRALESQEIKCEVRVGYQGTKILRIVEEGYQVTDEDIRTNKVLVELDSSELQKQIVQQEIQYQSAAANLTDAEQNFEIQLIQNQADIKASEQKVRFARMDFDKFLGDSVTARIIREVGLDAQLEAALTNTFELPSADDRTPSQSTPTLVGQLNSGAAITRPGGDAQRVVVLPGGGPPSGAPPPPAPPQPDPIPDGAPAPGSDSVETPRALAIDFSKYASLDVLGDGEAKQKLRKFEDDLQVARKEYEQASATRDGTQRLFDKGFVTQTDRQRDEIAHENSRLKVQTSQTARDLFLKYEFPKSAEEFLSKYADAVRELDKARRSAISKIAQAEAKLKSAHGQYNIQFRQRKDLNDQLEKCTIRSERPGLVVYGGSRDMYYGNQEPIREGATVRERQAIITIPDLSRMAVDVQIHESYIKKIKKGQTARITLDAFPDTVMHGEVTKVAVLPDSQNRWMNPDMKVYQTEITINDTNDWIKPGMSAKVEVFVDRLEDVVYVPVQAVVPRDGRQVCYVVNGRADEPREVAIGEFNDSFIEIREGLKEGESVLLRPPQATGSEGGEQAAPEPAPEAPPAAAAAATTP